MRIDRIQIIKINGRYIRTDMLVRVVADIWNSILDRTSCCTVVRRITVVFDRNFSLRFPFEKFHNENGVKYLNEGAQETTGNDVTWKYT